MADLTARIQNESRKGKTHEALYRIYQQYGMQDMLETASRIMGQCEDVKYPQAARGVIKGELAETVLELSLYELQKVVSPSMVIKGLCIKTLVGKTTTEMDLCLLTPYRLYMFESKSYKGPKVLHDECTLESKYGYANIYEQSKMHIEILNQYLSLYRRNRQLPGNPPYKMIFFEMSGETCVDKREEEWKKRIPYTNPYNLYDVVSPMLQHDRKDNWDYERAVKVLQSLSAESAKIFQQHLNRLGAD